MWLQATGLLITNRVEVIEPSLNIFLAFKNVEIELKETCAPGAHKRRQK